MFSTGKHLLIVEDAASIALFLKVNLRHQGFFVDIAATAGEAAAMMDQAGAIRTPPYDLVLVDLGLPDRDGTDLIADITGETGVPPVIAMSADTDAEVSARAVAAGAVLFIEKPVNMVRLTAAISETLEDRHYLKDHVTGAKLAEEHAALATAYRQHLMGLASDLGMAMPVPQLRSLLHQLKGSATLYGMTALSLAAGAFSRQLAEGGPQTARRVRRDLRDAILDAAEPGC
ncbi:response regulator [Eilatimonas milleporae]|uniref:Response regulator receiver domain-containing protein n=1 Tax=Eilatimonas milleporae TaxID=911205 RepID=A0A3M0CRT1_9PROT|nr:response regulator [Eilatimonas milleporae]RMB12284.1 response regulator receiver domain-containing protein [Eilatimonas milleporae]